MSTKYFILTKSNEKHVANIDNDQIIHINRRKTYILPQNNIEYYSSHGLFESNLIDWTKQFGSNDKVFLDIGAHTGTYTIALYDKFKSVYSFEPQKMTYYALCGSVALSNAQNVSCIQCGLGSPEQVGNMNLKIVSNDGGGSSLHSTSNILREEEIEVKMLDHFNIDNIGFIKMDVEENELFVLQGALETLVRSNYPPILFESNHANEELFEYLQKTLKYKIVKISGCDNMFLAER